MTQQDSTALALFPMGDKSRLPVTIYAGLAPSNPNAPVTWFKALDLANQGMLAHALIEEGLMEFDPEDKWFLAVKTLEAKGIRRGVTASEVARVLGCAPATAKRHMLLGEQNLYQVFGLNVCFASQNGVWRIATRDEVVIKYTRMGSELKAKFRRMQMYQPHMAALGGRPDPAPMEILLPLPAAHSKKAQGAKKTKGSGNAAD